MTKKQKNILVACWLGAMALNFAGIFIFGQAQDFSQGFTAALSIIMGWSFLFVVIKVGLERRHFKDIVSKINEVVKVYNQNSNGAEAVAGLKSLLKKNLTNDAENFTKFHIALILHKSAEEKEAKEVFRSINDFIKDPDLQAEYLQLRKELFSDQKN